MMKPIFHARFAFALLLLFGTDLRAGEKLTIATFNCEFLTTPKVHMKFGLPFDITNARPAEVERWANLSIAQPRCRRRRTRSPSC